MRLNHLETWKYRVFGQPMATTDSLNFYKPFCTSRKVSRKIHVFQGISRLEQRGRLAGVVSWRRPGRDRISRPRLIIGVTRHGRATVGNIP